MDNQKHGYVDSFMWWLRGVDTNVPSEEAYQSVSIENTEIKKICMESTQPLIALIKNEKEQSNYNYSLNKDFELLLTSIPDLVNSSSKVRKSISDVDQYGNNVIHLLLEKLVYHPYHLEDDQFIANKDIILGIQHCICVFVQYDPSLLQGQNIAGWTPFHMAARFSNLLLAHSLDSQKKQYRHFFEFLIQKGANLHAKDRDGSFPIHIAAGCGQSFGVLKLLELGSELHAPNRHGDTPIHLASAGRCTQHTPLPLNSKYMETCCILIDAVCKKNNIPLKETSKDAILKLVNIPNNYVYFPGSNVATLLHASEEVTEYNFEKNIFQMIFQTLIYAHQNSQLFFSGIYNVSPDFDMCNLYWTNSNEVCAEVLSQHQIYSPWREDLQSQFLHLLCVHPLIDLLETLPSLIKRETEIVSAIKNSNIHLEKKEEISDGDFERKGYSILHILMSKLQLDIEQLTQLLQRHYHDNQQYIAILAHLLKLTEENFTLITKLNPGLLDIQDAKGKTPVHQAAALMYALHPDIHGMRPHPFHIFIEHAKKIGFQDAYGRAFLETKKTTRNIFK